MEAAAKGGLNAFTKALAKELAPSNIQVNAIACGMIDTDMNSIFNKEEINEIVEKYEVQSEMVDTYVSLENVYGTCNTCVKNYHFPEILDE